MKQASLALLLAGGAEALSMRMEAGANPIRKVVTLMQDMQKEVIAEGEKDEELHKKFMCYCKTNSGAQDAAAAEAEAEMESKTAAAKEATAAKEQTAVELDEHKKSRAEDKEALAAATSQRKKEKKEFDEALASTTAESESCAKAITALEKGSSKSFLQTSFSASLKKLVESRRANGAMDVTDADVLLGFLQGDYHSVTGEIVGILKNMSEEFAKSLAEMQEEEAAALKTYGELKAAKEASIQAATEAIEVKSEKKGELAVTAAESAAAAEAAAKELEDAQNFLANLKESCATKATEYDERTAARQEEVKAIGEAINVLNSDDALETFSKAVKKPEEAKPALFLQMSVRKADPKSKALAMLQGLKSNVKHNKTVSLVMQTAVTALKSKKADFGKILKMIDDMVALLTQEGKDDAKTKEWCEGELNANEAKKKEIETELSALATRIEEAANAITEYEATIETKTAEIKALDEAVQTATETRKKEHAVYAEETELSNTAVKLLMKAKNKLNKFYNPSMYVPPEEKELTEEERLLQGAGQDIGETTTEAFSFLQTDSEAAPPPPPETGSYEKKGEKSNSVLALLDLIMNDLKKEAQAAAHGEKTAQRDYETLMADSTKSRAEYVQIIADTEASIVTKSEAKTQDTDSQQSNTKFLAETKEAITNLHGECDFIMENFESRAEQRTTEIEGLKSAKAVLSGANFS